VAILVVLGAGAFGYWYLFMRGIVKSDDARLAADRVDLAPDLPGRLDRLFVKEGDWVQKGQPVFVLDQSLLTIALEQAHTGVATARASLNVARAQLAKVLHGSRIEQIQMALDAVKGAAAQAQLTETEYARIKKLQSQGAVTKERLDQARAAWIVSKNARRAADHRLALVRHGARQEDIDAAKSGVDAANTRLQAAQVAVVKIRTDIGHSLVRAPFSGPVVRVWRRPGAMLAPGTPVVTLINPATLHVAANVEEKDLRRIAVGDPVDISVDAFPGHTLHGRLTRILRATNSMFSLIPSEGVSGTFIKVAQRVAIRISLDHVPRLPLSPGLSVVVRIHVHGSKASHLSATTAGEPATNPPSGIQPRTGDHTANPLGIVPQHEQSRPGETRPTHHGP